MLAGIVNALIQAQRYLHVFTYERDKHTAVIFALDIDA